jgi:hypothetical protein
VTWDRQLYFPFEERCVEDFFAWKIQRLWLGLNSRTWVPEASALNTRPPKPLIQQLVAYEIHDCHSYWKEGLSALNTVNVTWNTGSSKSLMTTALGSLVTQILSQWLSSGLRYVIREVSTACAYLLRILKTVTLRMYSNFLNQLRSHRRHFMKIVLCLCLFLCINHV